MNLHGLVSGAIGAVNPHVPVSVRVSTGYEVDEDQGFRQVPAYADAQVVQGQVQSLTYDDLRQIDSLNIQGTKRAIYLYGRIDGLVRVENKGGDLITVPGASFVGSISGTTLTVSSVNSGRISLNDVVSGSGVDEATRISALGTGIGYDGTYTVDVSQTIESEQMTSGAVWKVVQVLEQWPDWCKVAVTLQDGS